MSNLELTCKITPTDKLTCYTSQDGEKNDFYLALVLENYVYDKVSVLLDVESAELLYARIGEFLEVGK